ncbi:MAG: coniferyl aldehyde dehydrogenase [Gammaproteobacteria bacterium]
MPADKVVNIQAQTADMERVLELQKRAYRDQGPASAALRRDWIERGMTVLRTSSDKIIEAINEDFGERSNFQSMFADVFSAIDALKYSRKRLDRWMKPSKRRANFPFSLLRAKARVEYTPLGTVGCISPWNFPVYLTFAPLAGIFAAGNRAMIKPSELTPATSELMKEMFMAAYDEDEVAVFTGGPDVGQAFSKLNFDHLLYTGGGSVAKHIARAAADNLVPLTLELGGKSPVIVGDKANLTQTADKVMFGKMLNAGQICLAPDYLMLPKEQVGDFVQASSDAIKRYFPEGLKHNEDYTAIINDRHYDRIRALIEDARAKGGEIIELNPADEDFSQQPNRKIPPTLVVNPTDDMAVMQEEIFGPVLPVVGYDKIMDAVDRVNDRERPLGLYYFGKNKQEERQVLEHTVSGGVTVNDVLFHVSQHDLPFGGVGPSGSGRYQGYDGFVNFSHQRAIYTQTRFNLGKMFQPPHTEQQMKMLQKQAGIK